MAFLGSARFYTPVRARGPNLRFERGNAGGRRTKDNDKYKTGQYYRAREKKHYKCKNKAGREIGEAPKHLRGHHSKESVLQGCTFRRQVWPRQNGGLNGEEVNTMYVCSGATEGTTTS